MTEDLKPDPTDVEQLDLFDKGMEDCEGLNMKPVKSAEYKFLTWNDF